MSNVPAIAVTRIRELDLGAPTAPGRPNHLSAASGLVCVGPVAYVIADDELHLGIFRLDAHEPGELLRLFDGDLPDRPKARKREKPDVEAIVLLPPHAAAPHGSLFVLGSGSRPNRGRGALLALDDMGRIAGPPRIVDLSPIYETLAGAFGEINIEGAAVVADRLLLLQRGNSTDRRNAIARFALPDVLHAVTRGAKRVELAGLDDFDLGEIRGKVRNVPLSFTDAAALPDGRVVFTAVAEDTGNTYDDGSCVGAAIGMIAGNSLRRLQPLEHPLKIEGIHARVNVDTIELLLVTDADNADVPAALLSARIPA